MTDNETGGDFYFSESTTLPILLKPKKKEDIDTLLDFDIDVKRYKKTRVKRRTLRYVPKQD